VALNYSDNVKLVTCTGLGHELSLEVIGASLDGSAAFFAALMGISPIVKINSYRARTLFKSNLYSNSQFNLLGRPCTFDKAGVHNLLVQRRVSEKGSQINKKVVELK